MEIRAALILLALISGSIACIVATIWLIVLPFKESVRWGWACFLPLVKWYYAITRFKKCKVPLFVYVCGIIIMIAGIFFEIQFESQMESVIYSPTQIVENQVPTNRYIKLRGRVQKGSVKFSPIHLVLQFALIDNKNAVPIVIKTVVPDSFREETVVMVEGAMDQNRFIAYSMWTCGDPFIAQYLDYCNDLDTEKEDRVQPETLNPEKL